MGVLNAVFLVVGILGVIFVMCLLAIFLERKFPSAKYDERQKLSRGKAYRVSFWMGAVYYLVVMAVMIFQVEKGKTIEPYLLIFFGLIIQAMVFHFYCILTHAAIPLAEQSGIAVVSYLVCGLAQLLTNDYSGVWPLVGKGSEGWVRFVAGISFLILSLLHLVSILHREKE